MTAFFVFIALLLTVPGAARADGIPPPQAEFFVNDFAGILGSAAREEILAKGRAAEQATGAQIVAVTVESLGGKDRDEYALEMLRSWGIGQKDKNNGVLLLVAANEREVKIEVGYGLEGALPDGKCGRILDEYFVPAMREGDAGKAVLQTYDALLGAVAGEYGVAPEDIAAGAGYAVNADSALREQKSSPAVFIPLVIFWMFFAFCVFMGIFGRKLRGSSGRRGGWSGGSGGGFSGGGGFGGGGGGSHGGGGSGGGGGAGRSW